MKKNQFLLLAAGVNLSMSAFAQSSPPFSLEAALSEARTHLAETGTKLELEASKGKGFDVCEAEVLSLQKSYDQWFIDHYSEFALLRSSMLESIKVANQKIKKLENMAVNVNAVQGQSGEVSLNLKSLIAYFKNLNERLESCSEKDLKLLMASQENPNLNPLKISHSQALVAMEMMTRALNSSLSEESADYTFGFTASKRHFSIEFVLKARLNGKEIQYSVPFLNAASFEVSADETEMWGRLALQQVEVSGYSVDARTRYREFRNKNMQKECVEGKRVTFPGVNIGVPFASYAHASAQISLGSAPVWNELEFSQGQVSQVIISESNTIYALVSQGEISTVYSRSLSSVNWSKVTQGAIKEIAVDHEENLYALGFSGRLYFKDSKATHWKFYAGKGGIQKFAVSHHDVIHFVVGNRNIGSEKGANENYTTSSPQNIQSFVALNRSYFVLDTSGSIMKSELGKAWNATAITAPPAKAIQLAGLNDHEVFALCEDGQVYSYSDGFWFVVTGGLNGNSKLRSIYINQKHEIVGLSDSGKVYVLKGEK